MSRGAHLTFLPTCVDVPAEVLAVFRANAVDDGCGDAFLPIDVALEGLAGYAHAYLRIHLLDESRWASVLSAPLRDDFEARGCASERCWRSSDPRLGAPGPGAPAEGPFILG